MTETPATYTVDEIASTFAADQDMALATGTAEAIVAHFGVLLAAGFEYADAIQFASKFSDVLFDQYTEIPSLIASLVGGDD